MKKVPNNDPNNDSNNDLNNDGNNPNPQNRESEPPPLESESVPEMLSEAGTNKINRTDFNSKSSFICAAWFSKLSANATATDYLTNCVPSPKDIAESNTKLQLLKTEVESKPFRPHTTNFNLEVNSVKLKCESIAAFLEKTYPRNATIAGLFGMVYNQKPGGKLPPPADFVKNVDTNKEGRACRLTWENLKGFSGKGSYNVYMSSDAGLTFSLYSNVGNGKTGVLIPTVKGVHYVFYVVAKTNSGEGPQSARAEWIGQP